MADTNITVTGISSAEVQQLNALLKAYPVRCVFDGTDLGPLASPPAVSPQMEHYEPTLYENMGQKTGKIVVDYFIEITIESRNIAAARALKNNIKLGMDLYGAENQKALQLVPITADSSTSIISFPKACLQNGLQPNFKEGREPNTETLVIHALCGDDGKPFTLGV